MRHGNFSKKYTSNLDEGLPTWLQLKDATNTQITQMTDSLGGIKLNRISNSGEKRLDFIRTIDENLSAIGISVILNGLVYSVDNTLDIGLYGDENNYIFLRFRQWATDPASLIYSVDGVETQVTELQVQNIHSNKFRKYQVFYNFKTKVFEVIKNDSGVYVSLDNINIDKAGMRPMLRWNNSAVTANDRLAFIEIENFYL